MRIGQFSYSASVGGASRAVRKLHEALKDAGEDARLIVADRSGNDATDHPVSALGALVNRAEAYLDGGLSLLQRPQDRMLRGVATFPTTLPRRARHEGLDVVNLHWVGLGTASVAQLGRLMARTPTVWSLHDMWAVSGAEFYGDDETSRRRSEGYQRGNRNPEDRGLDIDRWVWNRKVSHFRTPVHIVTASRWLAGLSRDSQLTSAWPVSVIPYSIDTELFRPGPSRPEREHFGIDPDLPVVLFGANKGPADPRKGWDLLVEALRRVHDEGIRFRLAVFGRAEPELSARFPFPISWLGEISGDETLARVYRLADVIAIPSRQDNLPLTGLEAQTSGIPVLAFNATGMPDVAVHDQTGYLARPFDTADLARGLSHLLTHPDHRTRLSEEARRRALRLWSPDTIARQYVEVYRETIDRHPGRVVG